METYHFTVIIERQPEGEYTETCQAFQTEQVFLLHSS